MGPEQVRIVLVRAPDDPRVSERKFQEELREFSESLRAAGVSFSQRAMAFDSVDAAGYPLPEFLVTLGPPAIAALAAIAGAWVQARYVRKMRLKVGDVEAEGRTEEEIKRLLEHAAKFQDTVRGPPARIN
jgi:hypothetical protein